MSDRLNQLRSFIWWTLPLYVVFAGVGLFETRFALTLALAVLFALLAAFGLFDGIVLATLGSLRARTLHGPDDLAAVRTRLERLSRAVIYGGGTLAVVALVTVVVLALAAS